MSKKKDVLIGIFAKEDEVESVINKLVDTHNKNKEWIFVYSIEGNEKERLITFKSNWNKDIIKDFDNGTIFHVKNKCLFSINALNKLIEQENGSLDNTYQVDWNKYENTLMIIEHGTLSIKKLTRL